MRVPVGKVLAIVLVTLSVGLQVLEATGRWDLTLQDSQDEFVIVAAALCIGAALVVAARTRPQFSSTARHFVRVFVALARSRSISPLWSPLSSSPPANLRI